LFLFGTPKAVFADICKEREFSKIDDYCAVTLFYENQFRLLIKSTLLVADIGPSYILNGHKGSFVKYRANILEEQLAKGIRPGDENFGKENENTAARLTTLQSDGLLKTVKYLSPDSSYTGFYQQLGEAINDMRAHKCATPRLPVEPKDALDGIRIIEAAYKSAEYGKIINL
jgi:scyllo-inositol 2-dehydrogenase (NADP+)